jgi:hypothetical protein
LHDALAWGEFDAVDIMLPHHLHEEAAVQCLEAGKHVLLEKPMAISLTACKNILACAKNSGKFFMVNENAQYWPEVGSLYVYNTCLELNTYLELITSSLAVSLINDVSSFCITRY